MNKKLLSGAAWQPGQTVDFPSMKVSTTNIDSIQKTFLALADRFQQEIDVYFKNYNRFITEPKNKIDVQVKATKKEKLRHIQFYAKQELKFWEKFPRNKKFYNKALLEIRNLLTQERWSDDDVREVDHLVLSLLELMPNYSRKYCKIFEKEFVVRSSHPIITFDQVTENLRMFDSNDIRNWSILASSVTLMVTDVIAVILDPSICGAPLFVGQETSQALLKQMKHYCQMKVENEEEESSEGPYSKQLYEQVQFAQSSQIFTSLSRSSRLNFDACLKFVQQALSNDHRKFEENKIQEFMQQVYFGRYLYITPSDLEMGAKVLSLLDTYLQMLQSKASQLFKEVLLASLRNAMQFLWFNEDSSQLKFDKEAMNIQWVCVQKIFAAVDTLQQKKENLREEALLLMATILKIAPDDFVEQNLAKFLATIKFQNFFQSKREKEAKRELQILCQLIIPGPIYYQAYKAWQPKVLTMDVFFRESETKIHTPVQVYYASQQHIGLQRKFGGQILIPNLFKLFETIFSPKNGLPVEHCHWQLLEQLSFDDLSQVVNLCLPHLLSFRNCDYGADYLDLGLKLCNYLLDPKFAFLQKYQSLHRQLNTELHLKRVRELATQAIKETLSHSPHLKTLFIQQCLHFYKLQSINENFVDQINPTTYVCQQRVSSSLSKQHKIKGKFYLQDKSRSITFDDANELERLDFTYDDELLNQIRRDLQISSTFDKPKEQFIRHRMVSHLAEAPGERQNVLQYSGLPACKNHALNIVVSMLDLMPFLDINDCVFFLPCNQVSLKGDLTSKASQTIGHPCQQMSSEITFLSECERLVPLYYLMCLDLTVQLKAQKCILKMMVSASVQIKIALLDQICYLLKEFYLVGNQKYIKTLTFVLMNTLYTWLWTERSRFSTTEKISGVIEVSQSDIKYIYSSLHVFKLVDCIALIGLCSKDISLRQASALILVDIAKIKRLIVKKELWSPLIDDLLYTNQTKLQKNLMLKLTIVNTFRGCPPVNEHILEEIGFTGLLIDNFEYQSNQLSEQLVRDLQVMYLGEVLKLYKAEILAENKSDLKRDIKGTLILNLLSILSSRQVANFENSASGEQSDPQPGQNCADLNLLFAIVISNISRSHQRLNKSPPVKQEKASEQYEEVLTSGDSIVTNTLLEEARTLVGMLETNLGLVHKIQFNKYYPPRIWTSNVLFTFLYYLQDDVATQGKSFENLNEVFLIQRVTFESKNDFAQNCILFHTLLSCENSVFKYIEAQQSHLRQFVSLYEIIRNMEFPNDPKLIKQSVLSIMLVYNVCTYFRSLNTKTKELKSTLSSAQQQDIFKSTREQYKGFEKSTQLKWLCPLIKTIWHLLITLQNGQEEQNLDLDLRFLIQMEQEGYQGCLNSFNSRQVPARQNQAQETKRINEIKLLIQYVYAFNAQPARDQSGLLYQVPTTQIQKNVYFKCLTSIVDTSQIRMMLESCSFEEVWLFLSKHLIGTKTEKLVKAGLVAKLFLVCLFITLNAVDKQMIEKARIICLATIPLMFTDKSYEKEVQMEIKQADISGLIHFESRLFFQFVKKVFKNEEAFNMKNHFEKYFSLSGFLRDLLNEIIKLQTGSDSPSVQPRMLLRVLDMITYFFSGISLRRAPVTDEGSFIFAHLIDYKSFEFLSKLYKISERLVDFDNENMTIMNMWYKICEGRESNFEVLAKFLIHNLSSYVMKMKTTSGEQDESGLTTEIELEKHKRYSLSIFNYIKARTQQIDVRNSLNIKSVTWSQKMLKVVLRTQLNLMSKYTLEKLKLKKVLEQMHGEINQSGLKLQLKGGLDTLNPILRGDEVRSSISMAQLLQSQTFLQTFSQKKANGKAQLRTIIFVLERQMKDRFHELTPENQVQRVPDLVLRYFENTLILIANESERIQIIKYSPTEELIVVVLILILICDMALKVNSSDSNRAYFLYDLLYKLSINISGIQRYIKSVSIEQFCQLKSETDILNLFNCRQTFDLFPKFTTIYFKLLSNLTTHANLFSMMVSIWKITLSKHHLLISKESTAVKLIFSRSSVFSIIRVCFMVLHELTKTKNQKIASNFGETFEGLFEMVIPSIKSQVVFRDFSDSQSKEIAFATNVIYWTAFGLIESQSFQDVGVPIMRGIMEESDFYKELLSQLTIAPTFFRLKLPQIRGSLLSILFTAVSHPIVSQDVFKCILVTIKAQDSLLVSNQGDQARDELHRFLILLPFLMNQFTIQDVTQSIAVFTNKRSVVQLLKKSLPSISISTKKEILQILDSIQREVEQDDRALIQEQFLNLIEEVKSQLLLLSFGRDVLESFVAQLKGMIRNNTESIRRELLETCLQKLQFDATSSGPTTEINWPIECLGEESAAIPKHIRTAYFNLKHICMQEIELQGADIDCQFYFCGVESQAKPAQQRNQLDQKLERQFSTEYEPKLVTIRRSSNVYSKKQEIISKYQNSGNQQIKNQSTLMHNQERISVIEESSTPTPSEVKSTPETNPGLRLIKDISSELKPYREKEDDDEQLLVSPKLQKGNSAFEQRIDQFKNELNPLGMEMSQQISSISLRQTDRGRLQTNAEDRENFLTQKIEDARPQTGQFIQDEFDFTVDHPGYQYISNTADVMRPHEEEINPKINRLVESEESKEPASQKQTKPQPSIDNQLKQIVQDDDMLYQLEQFLEQNNFDLDNLAFYLKVIDFRQEKTNRNIVAGLILDNYLSEEAEFYIGSQFSDQVIGQIISDFKQAIESDSAVSATLFAACADQVRNSGLESLVLKFMSL